MINKLKPYQRKIISNFLSRPTTEAVKARIHGDKNVRKFGRILKMSKNRAILEAAIQRANIYDSYNKGERVRISSIKNLGIPSSELASTLESMVFALNPAKKFVGRTLEQANKEFPSLFKLAENKK